MNEKAGSMTSKDGCKCECPTPMINSIPFCCKNCWHERRYFINDKNRHLWTEEGGFHSSEGCKLPRNEMPPECLEYDCRRYAFIILRVYSGRWQDAEVKEFSIGKLGELNKCLAKL